MPRPPLPPFTLETAIQKVRLGKDAWNSCDPLHIAEADRLFHWPSGRRPDDHASLTELGP